VLLSEFGVPAQTIAADAFRTVVALLGTLPPAIAEAPAGSVAVLLGQYLSALDILTPDEETSLHLDMVQGAVAAGFRRLVFKPHPGAPPLHVAPLQAEAGRLGAELTVEDEPALVESWFGAPAIGCVVGCFSTALLTAASGYGLPAARVGTRLVMERLRPFHNSNRIPLTLVDACLPDVGRLQAGPEIPVDVTALVRAVSYCMQPDRYPGLRADAQALLEQSWPTLGRYFRRRRLTLLDLPGRLEPRSAPWGLLDARRRAARHLRNLGRAGGIVRAARRLGAASSKPRTSAHPRRSLAPRARTSPAGEGPGVLGQDLIDR
jgi:hypothetical protein